MSTLSNPISVEQFDKAVAIGKVSWVNSQEMNQDGLRRALALYDLKSTSELREEFGGVPSGSGFAASFSELEDLPQTSDVEGDYITSQLRSVGFLRTITGDFLRYNKYPKLKEILTKKSNLLFSRMALDATHKFTFATSATYNDMTGRTINNYGADGLALAHDTHVLNNGDSFDNQLVAVSNVAGRFSEATWEDAENLSADFLDHAGKLVTVNLNTVLTTHDANTRNTVKRLNQQHGQVSVANTTNQVLNDLNPYQGTLNHIILPYLATNAAGNRDSSKNRWWFGIDSMVAKENLKCRVGLAPTMFEPVLSEKKDAILYKGMAQYDMLHVGAEFLVCSPAG